ncbi:uncharacterized protein LOC123206345 [Mangifera indica]|uniref:uncharacterized protein LOC123206345 n=1 Tax=Mangifera indica TaxID=29780 RepID=UPI001CF9D4D7|nr:uncharacterized protein LOC123206345 [Mangifera indica]
MEGSDGKSVSSKVFVNIDCSTTSADENDESMSLPNSKKPITGNQSKSPTISTASKTIAPIQNILAEKNEICETHIPKPSSFTFSDNSLSFSDDSSLKSYDPLANCTSPPRPKFLRYKPNRRREIILRHENKVKKMEEEANIVSASQEGSMMEEVEFEGGEEEEEEEEEEGEESEGFLRRFLKFVLVVLVLVFSILCVSSMNSPTCSHAFQAIEVLKDKWYPKIHDGVYDAIRSLRGADNFLRTRKFKGFVKIFMVGSEYAGEYMGFIKLNQTFFIEGYEEVMVDDVNLKKVEEVSDNLGELVEMQGGETKDLDEMVELQAGESENSEGFDQMIEGVNLVKVEEVSDKHGELEELQVGGSKDFGEIVELQAGESENVEGFHQILETEGNVAKIESFGDNQGSDVALEQLQEGVDSEHVTDVETLNSEAESSFKEGLLEQIETDNTFMAVVGVALHLGVIVSLLMVFNLKKKRNTIEKSPLIITPCHNESGVIQKCISETPKEKEEFPHVKFVDSFSSSLNLVNTIVKDSKDIYQNRGPSIELLPEFEVGEVSSSLRKRGMKKSTIEESAVSRHSIPSVSSRAQSDFSEFSNTNFFSCGDFTPGKKILKEDGRDGEAKEVISSVRRSSRLRNRAITSP